MTGELPGTSGDDSTGDVVLSRLVWCDFALAYELLGDDSALISSSFTEGVDLALAKEFDCLLCTGEEFVLDDALLGDSALSGLISPENGDFVGLALLGDSDFVGLASLGDGVECCPPIGSTALLWVPLLRLWELP